MAQYQKFMFDNFVIACEDEADKNEPLPQENEEIAETVTDAEFQELPPEPVIEETPPASYTQDELDAAVIRAEQKGYESGFQAASSDNQKLEQELLGAVDSKLMGLLAEIENYKTQLERDSLKFAAGVIRKILPVLEQERAAAEVERFMAENFPSFRKEPMLSFSFNPETAAAAAGVIARLAEKNDFEGKIAVHKDAALGIADVRIRRGNMDKNLELDELGESPVLNEEPVLRKDSGSEDFDIPTSTSDLEAVYNIPVKVSAILGKTHMKVSQLMKLNKGAIIELDRKVGEAIDIYVNNNLVARGEVVVVDDKLGITMTEIIKSVGK